MLWSDELTRSNHYFNLVAGETPTIVGTGTLQLTHDLVLELGVMR
jgi:hypothetical protein